MGFAATAPLAIFAVVCTVVAIRLLRIGLRTRAVPELAISTGLLLIALVGMPLLFAGRMPSLYGSLLGDWLFALGFAAATIGCELFFVFNWSVFRRDSRWALAVVIVAGLAFAVIWWVHVSVGSSSPDLLTVQDHNRPWSMAMVALLMGAFAWSGIESIRFWGLQRRRLAIGLADPVVANRFLLWAIGGFAITLLGSVVLYCQAQEMLVLREATPMSVVAVMGALLSLVWWLSFMPPVAYKNWLIKRAAAQ